MDVLDVLGDAELRRTLLFVRAQERGVTAEDVARALAVPRTAARWRLEKLLSAGLVAARFERRSGRRGPGAGRPSKEYAPAAETTQVEFPRRRHELLVSLLIAALPRRRRANELRAVGVAFGAELAAAAHVRKGRAVRAALERVCRGLGELGFHASVRSVTRSEAVIESATCPLRPLVVADEDVQAIDEGMWCGLVDAALETSATQRVACRTHGCLDGNAPCRIVVAFAGNAP